ADILNTSVNVPEMGEDAANYGAAALAFNALGLSDIGEFSSKWVEVKEKINPILGNRMIYEKNYAMFIELVKLIRETSRGVKKSPEVEFI
ncbi:MAG: hypothetical protein QW797_06915, partial [Thermoproteota archaeon]